MAEEIDFSVEKAYRLQQLASGERDLAFLEAFIARNQHLATTSEGAPIYHGTVAAIAEYKAQQQQPAQEA